MSHLRLNTVTGLRKAQPDQLQLTSTFASEFAEHDVGASAELQSFQRIHSAMDKLQKARCGAMLGQAAKTQRFAHLSNVTMCFCQQELTCISSESCTSPGDAPAGIPALGLSSTWPWYCKNASPVLDSVLPELGSSQSDLTALFPLVASCVFSCTYEAVSGSCKQVAHEMLLHKLLRAKGRLKGRGECIAMLAHGTFCNTGHSLTQQR